MTSALPDEARFRLLVENIGDVLWFKELDPARFTYVSPAFERIWGHGVAALQKKPRLWEDGIHPEDRKAVREALRQWFSGEKADYEAHYRVIGKNGEVRWLADRGIILGRKNGKPYQIGGIARDITEREAAEATRKRLAAVVENSDDAIITLDLGGVIQTWNAGAERIFQYSAAEAVGRPVSILRPPEAADDEAFFRRCIRRGKRIEHYETQRVRKDGRVIDISLSISPLMDAAGHLAGFSKISRDITQQNVGRRIFDRLLEAAPDGFVILDAQGLVWLANARAESLFGIPRKAMIGTGFELLLPLQERHRFGKLRADFLALPVHAERFRGMELAGLRKDGGEFPMEISLSQVETPEGTLIIIDITDITERKTAEQTIRLLNAELEQRVQQRTAELMEQIVARRQLEAEILEISEREQRRIGQDLHDDLGQQLAGAWMMAEVLQRTLEAEKSPRHAEVKKIGGLLQKALAHTRGLARGLHPVAPEQGGFARALENLAAQSSELFGVRCRFEGREAVQIESEPAMMHLYRIAQEAVSNAVKHGRAATIRIRLTKSTLTITDDGGGLQSPAKTEGMGLRIMRYRAEMTGGTLKVESGRRKGVVVTCQFPSTLSHAEENHP
ncbi:PAS domain S-box protein [Prosthecobacter sp.]|uniref:sensor histidine kinase n=1 Tax=Prosthecobacter sp. TaxID=1965333 RepID=UPI00248729C0|nr:PAS domain S-box protein [Prosthecobacter sp.]MDI1311819.1 PAS domain S-box protein [Prosthecobacter sp.]